MTQSLAQQRAKDALNKVEKLVQENDYGNYKSYVSGLPAEIIMSGLGQAMALVKSKSGKKGNPQLYTHLNTWLCDDRKNAPYPTGDLIKHITEGDESKYIHAQEEAMAYLEWLKKFAVALLDDGEG